MSEAVVSGPITVGAAMEAVAGRLSAAGLEAPRREALRLTADLLRTGPGRLALRPADALSAEDAERLELAVTRRAAGEPLAYVTGVTGFRRLTLAIDGRALIPRPETEGLVELVLERSPEGVAVDVGTGSGCIALSLATEGRYRRVLAIDRSPAALALAAANAARTGGRVHLLRADLVAPLGAASVDVLVSNPPYVSDGEHAHLDPGVRDYEPAEALRGGADGMGPTRRLLADGLRVVRPGGTLALELAAERGAAAAREARDLGWVDVAVVPDCFGRSRYLLARRREE